MKIFGKLTAAAALLTITAASAGPQSSADDAVAMVKRAVTLIKTAGPQNAYKAFMDTNATAFRDGDLYVWVYDYQGNCLAHGANPKLAGKNMIEMRDMDGKEHLKAQISVAKNGGGWYGPFRFLSRTTGAVDVKKAYCLPAPGETMVCSAVYVEQ